MRHYVLLVITALTACTATKPWPEIPLPGRVAADALGPHQETKLWPRVFVSDAVKEEALVDLAPFAARSGVYSGFNQEFATQAAVRQVIEFRPDVILVSLGQPKVTGVSTTLVPWPSPFMPLLPINSTQGATPATAFAMRAMPVRLPFRYNVNTGTVLDVPMREAVEGGLLEGDTLTTIDGASAIPPKRWAEWEYYARMLARKPGDTVPLEWVRAGVGKMRGTVRLDAAEQPFLDAADSIDVSYMPEVREEVDPNGRPTWRMGSRWDDDQGDRSPRSRSPRNR